MRLIDADKIDTRERGNNSQSTMWWNIKKIIDEAPTVEAYTLEDMQNNYDAGAAYEAAKHDWIPIKMRPGTDEEYEEFSQYGDCPREDFRVFECQLPEDDQEVLVTTRWGDVCIDIWHRDVDCCYFENNSDDGDVIAWMPKPEGYKPEVQHDSL